MKKALCQEPFFLLYQLIGHFKNLHHADTVILQHIFF